MTCLYAYSSYLQSTDDTTMLRLVTRNGDDMCVQGPVTVTVTVDCFAWGVVGSSVRQSR